MFISMPLNSNLEEGSDRGETRFSRWEEKNDVSRRDEGDEVELADGWDEEKIAETSCVK